MEWTQDRVQMLRDLWAEGLSASQIAERLGGTTRNAVIGKAHRLHLKSRPSPIKRQGPAILTLKENMCRWPIGTPGQPGFTFCGEQSLPGRPYCASHCELAYQKKRDTAA